MASNLGGSFYFQATGVVPDGADTAYDFTSVGTTDGAILIGQAQGNGAFATSFAYGAPTPALAPNFQFRPNSCGSNQLGAGALCGDGGNTGIGASYNAGVLTLDVSKFGGYYDPYFTQFPLGGAATVSASALGAGGLASNQFYYTADWTHTITAAESAGFAGQIADWHIEGVGTVAAVPEASTYGMMLAGLGLVGFAVRRRKLMA